MIIDAEIQVGKIYPFPGLIIEDKKDIIGQRWFAVPVERYPDGTPMVKFDTSITDIDTMILRPKSFDSFMAGLMFASAAEERGVHISKLVLPFILGARQDRLNPEGDYLFTLKNVAYLINSIGFDRVVVVDPHSLVAPALIDRCTVIGMDVILKGFNNEYNGVIAPDVGAVKRATEAARVLGLPVLQGNKHRDVATGKLTDFSVSGIASQEHYLVVDDICDGGGTFVGLADEIQEVGATADLFVTHGIFSQGTARLASKYRQVFTTDTTLYRSATAFSRTIPILERIINA